MTISVDGPAMYGWTASFIYWPPSQLAELHLNRCAIGAGAGGALGAGGPGYDGARVMVGMPALAAPFSEASEVSVLPNDRGRIDLAPGFPSHCGASHVRGNNGGMDELWLGGTRYLPEAQFAAELAQGQRTGS